GPQRKLGARAAHLQPPPSTPASPAPPSPPSSTGPDRPVVVSKHAPARQNQPSMQSASDWHPGACSGPMTQPATPATTATSPPSAAATRRRGRAGAGGPGGRARRRLSPAATLSPTPFTSFHRPGVARPTLDHYLRQHGTGRAARFQE